MKRRRPESIYRYTVNTYSNRKGEPRVAVLMSEADRRWFAATRTWHGELASSHPGLASAGGVRSPRPWASVGGGVRSPRPWASVGADRTA